MTNAVTFVLIHSPLVGPFTWELVRRELTQRHIDVVVPPLIDRPDSTQPYWQQHASSVAQGLDRIPHDHRLVLVAHSGAGPLLPVIRQVLPHSIGGYVFVDAGLPRNGLSRLDLMKLQDQVWAADFQQALLRGERFPDWTSDALADIIPAENLRRQLLAELQPRSWPFFIEPIPVFHAWPDAACAYIQFSPPYAWDAQQAKSIGWPVREVNAGHFHMLVDPRSVADWIVAARSVLNVL